MKPWVYFKTENSGFKYLNTLVDFHSSCDKIQGMGKNDKSGMKMISLRACFLTILTFVLFFFETLKNIQFRHTIQGLIQDFLKGGAAKLRTDRTLVLVGTGRVFPSKQSDDMSGCIPR